jgi:pyruvate/2-oxoacid:ferredoxin oxidoreductase alpha subunit
MICEKYERMQKAEQRANLYDCDDAEILVMACNTPGQMAKGAVEKMRRQGIKVGLFHPVTLWPFPIDKLKGLLDHVTDILVVEGSPGQLEDELRLALSHADVHGLRIHHLRHMGGMLPQESEILEKVDAIQEVSR